MPHGHFHVNGSVAWAPPIPPPCCTWTGGGCLYKHQTRPQGHALVHTTMPQGHRRLPSHLPSLARRGSADVLIFEQPTSLLVYVGSAERCMLHLLGIPGKLPGSPS